MIDRNAMDATTVRECDGEQPGFTGSDATGHPDGHSATAPAGKDAVQSQFGSTRSTIGEPSFADAIAWIGEDESLSPSQRLHWPTSLRRIAEFLDRPPASIPARLTSVRLPISRLNAASLGVTAKTLSNHKSNVRAALLYLRGQKLVPPRGTPLSARWQVLVDVIDTKHFRITLLAVARYCSGQGIDPSQVSSATIDAYFAHREQTTFLVSSLGRRRTVARAWNHGRSTIPGWPDTALDVEALPAPSAGPKWEEFPETLRKEIETYLAGLTGTRRGPTGKRIQPCKSSTIRGRRRELKAYLRKAVAAGISVENLASLRHALSPATVKTVLEAYWPDETVAPSTYAIDIAWKLWSIAGETGCLTETELAELEEIQAYMARFKCKGLTPKNMAVVRRVVTTDAWRRVIALPEALMAEARARRDHSPVRAAALAGVAVAIRILTVAPVRIGNLSAIRLDENLIRPGGPGTPFTLIFTEYDTKNRVPLEFPLDASVTGMIDEYVHDFRPALMRGHNSDWLFPGEGGKHKGNATLSHQICQRIERHVGFPVTAHQFRHAAAAIILKVKPGDYELVRRVLGHKSINTTTNFYIGLEAVEASRAFGRMVADELANQSERADDED